jgi:AcrR family transcriptional regulator
MGTETAAPAETPSTRGRILQIALQLMAQRGVDGTSMRDLASAAGLNVASLYHYFPSKRELLEAVLIEHGFYPVQARQPKQHDAPYDDKLVGLLSAILTAMFEVEDFVRLMVGEAMRGEQTATSMGTDLFANFERSIEEWIVKHRPDLAERAGAGATARLLASSVVGVFVQHACGVFAEKDEEDLGPIIEQRAKETAQILGGRQ